MDDTRMFRDALRVVMDLEEDIRVVGVAGDGVEGVELARTCHPDVVLMDIRMPTMDGVEATRRLLAEQPGTQVIMLTTYMDDDLIFEALKAGAVGYLLKEMPATELIQAVRAVRSGGALISPAVAARLVAEYVRLSEAVSPAAKSSDGPPPAMVTRLSPREHEILEWLAHGLNNREIAGRLYLGEGTVRNYVSSILSKLHARDRAQAIAFAHRLGLVD